MTRERAKCGWISKNEPLSRTMSRILRGSHTRRLSRGMPRQQAGYIGGVAGFLAAAAARRRRDTGDTAELVDVSEVEAFALTVHPWAIAAVYENTGFSFGPAGGRHRGEPGPLWDEADGRMNFGFDDFRNWTAAMEVLQLPELGAHDNLIPDVGRHSQDLSEVVAGAGD